MGEKGCGIGVCVCKLPPSRVCAERRFADFMAVRSYARGARIAQHVGVSALTFSAFGVSAQLHQHCAPNCISIARQRCASIARQHCASIAPAFCASILRQHRCYSAVCARSSVAVWAAVCERVWRAVAMPIRKTVQLS